MYTDSSHRDNDEQDLYVAVAPCSPLRTTLHNLQWSISTGRRATESEERGLEQDGSSIKVNPNSIGAQALLRAVVAQDLSRHGSYMPKTIDVKITATTPVALDTVYVTIEKDLLDKVDEIQNKFGGGFPQSKTTRGPLHEHAQSGAKPVHSSEDRVIDLVRQGLSALNVVHTGDIFGLPLPAHPITHVRPAPAAVIEVEPVRQGVLAAYTKIVVVRAGGSQEKALKKLVPPAPILEESLEDTADDTANDQFFSAAEDRSTTTASDAETTDDDDPSGTSDSHDEVSEEDSDSMDDMIALTAPGLPPQQAGTLSAMSAATPRPGLYKASGLQTPGSVYSSFTTSTARAGSRPGKVFRTEALLQKVSREMLHPKPSVFDDDDSFVFIDTTTLAKLGCFSGDWARIEVAKNVSRFGFGSSFASMNTDEDVDFRVVRVYGLPGLLQNRARYAVDKTGERRSSFSQSHVLTPSMSALYLSPVLLANLSSAQFVKLGAMPKDAHSTRTNLIPRPVSRRAPPLAREVSLSKVLTPLTQDPVMQNILVTALKHHFEAQRRLVKIGDVVGVPVDEDLARTSASIGTGEADLDVDQLLSNFNVKSATDRQRLHVAWFVVQSLDAEIVSDHGNTTDEVESWGGTATLDTSHTKLSVSGTSHRIVSGSVDLWSHYWLDLKRTSSVGWAVVSPLVTTASLPVISPLPLQKRVADLVSASTSLRAISLGLPPLVILLHSTQRQIGKSHIAHSACASVGVHTFAISAHDLLSENASSTGGGDVKTEALLRARTDRALSCGVQQTALLIEHIDVLTADRMVPVLRDVLQQARVLIATTSKLDDVPAELRSLFTHELEVTAPDERSRETILHNVCATTNIPLSPTVSIKGLALQTAALVAGDLVDVVQRACLARSKRLAELAEQKDCTTSDISIAGGLTTTHLLPTDLSTAISAARSTFSDAIGAPKIPTVTWKDVGGLASQKDSIMETISLPLTHPELFANGVRKRSGILFYGPPGTGKTLLAKAIATEFSLNFFSVKGPELLNMYIGESEANVRRVFQRARDARPCVVFFDELDSVAPKRGNQGDSGGVMDRIVSQLLAELDGMSSDGSSPRDGQVSNAGGVFVIGATNRPDLLDPALLRPGRFDKMLYLGVADSHQAQVTILEALTRKFQLARGVDLKRVAEKLPFTYTGADLYALCSDAMLKAITRKTRAVDDRVAEMGRKRGENVSTAWFFDHAATTEDTEIIVDEEDFDTAQRELVGSVSAKELEHFERIRKLFEDQDISADSGQPRPSASGANLPIRVATRTNTMVDVNGELNHSSKVSKGKQSDTRHPDKNKAATHPIASSVTSDNDYGLPATNNTRSINGYPESISSNGVGTGKGKGKAVMHDFTDNTGDDEDLYS